MNSEPDHWTRLGLIFEEAVRLEPAARGVFVAEAAAGDADLEREVLSLLASHTDAGTFLDRPVADIGAALLGAPSRVFGPGRDLGPYRLLEELGHGGMGQVFLAEDTRLGRRVALKVLDQAHVASEASRERLRHEARAAALLSHPGIATVFVLEDIEGELCLAVEHVSGRTLRDWIDDGERPLREVVDIACQVAAALEAAHRCAVVHRDLKPDNIMVDDQAHTRILDFGIARVLGLGDSEQRLTDPGAAIGTPAYMAPEQLQGDPVDFRTDLFAFGIVLYELVAGVHPFMGPTRTATQARILTATPASLTRFRTPLPSALQHIVSTCLQKAPGDRYQATADLVRDLSAIAQALDDSAGRAIRPGSLDAPRHDAGTARRLWRAHQLMVMTGVLGVLIASAWVTAWIGGAAQYPLFLGLLVCGVCAGTLRTHLLFVEWTRPVTVPDELRRLTPWLRGLDLVFGLASGGSALAVGPGHPFASALVLIAAAIITVSVFVMEPATTRSAFNLQDSQ